MTPQLVGRKARPHRHRCRHGTNPPAPWNQLNIERGIANELEQKAVGIMSMIWSRAVGTDPSAARHEASGLKGRNLVKSAWVDLVLGPSPACEARHELSAPELRRADHPWPRARLGRVADLSVATPPWSAGRCSIASPHEAAVNVKATRCSDPQLRDNPSFRSGPR